MEQMSDPGFDQRLYLCSLIIVFAAAHVVIGMVRGARSWRAILFILLALAILFSLLARSR